MDSTSKSRDMPFFATNKGKIVDNIVISAILAINLTIYIHINYMS
jgi:hypothetical protein